MLAVFAEFERDILRDRVKAGIAHARAQGRPHGRPVTIQSLIPKIRELAADGVSKRQIAATLGISRTSVRRLRTQTKRSATDPVDAAKDAEVLSLLLASRASAMLRGDRVRALYSAGGALTE